MNKTIIAALLASSVSLLADEPGKVINQIWQNISGFSVSSILNNEQFYGAADIVQERTTLSVSNSHNKTNAQRVRGYIVAPVTGTYRFWLTGDDSAQFSLSPTASKWDKEILMEISTWKHRHDWDNGASSADVQLVAGQEYFVDLVQKNGQGLGHADVAWAYEDQSYENWAVDSAALATQSNVNWYGVAERANDGDTNGDWSGGSVTHTHHVSANWWQVDLGADRPIDRIVLWNRSSPFSNRLSNFKVSVLAVDGSIVKTKDFYLTDGHVNVNEVWDFESAVTGAIVKVEMLGLNRAGNHILSLAEVQVFGSSDVNAQKVSRQLIGAEHLKSYTIDASDSDMDELKDSWELTHDFDTTTVQTADYSSLADIDKDGLTSIEESAIDTNPFLGTSVTGYWTVEKWSNVVEYGVSDLVKHDRFFQEADSRALIETNHFTDIRKYSATRLRGYITAPETGTYRFWLSSVDGSELWISTDDTKYRKQLLAGMGPRFGTGHGIKHNSSNLWDQFSSQMSEEVYLLAGQKYYCEMLTQQGHAGARHLSIAWARPDQQREALPMEFVSSYEFTPEDYRDDYLPDAWESQYGLNPDDNGGVDRLHEGENGDFDMDGLSNRLEYVYGSNPANPDYDGDGILDGDEVHTYGTDPSISDAPAESLVSTLNIDNFTSADAAWTSTSEGLIGSTFRGGIDWSFTAPNDGHYILHISTKLLGDLYLNETVPATVSIDGAQVWKSNIVYGQQREALVRVTTPYLTAGSHTVRLFIDNVIARRSVSIKSIQVFQPNGVDSDGDGQPDWVESQLTGINTLFAYPSASRTSPAFLEGNTRILSQTLFNNQSVKESTGSNGWYTDLALNADGTPTDFIVNFESGIVDAGAVTWQSTNILANESLIIRKGDSLKLVAQPNTGSTGQSTTVHVPEVNWTQANGAVATQSSTGWNGVARAYSKS